MLQQFKTFDADRMDMEQLIELYAFGHLFRDTYEKLNIEEPEFVDVQLKNLKRSINSKRANELASRRKEIVNRLESLKTPTERKSALSKELKDIDAQLQEA